MNDEQRTMARARLLRREGKTYAEIRTALGIQVSDDRLQRWLRGIPRPFDTHRSNPRRELQRECRRLRARGYTYSEIAEATGASHGSISPWVRDVRVPSRDRAERRRLDALRESARQRKLQANRRSQFEVDLAATSVGPLGEQQLFLLGVALYWAEGSKSKVYSRRERVTFVNSDPQMVDVFVAWLRLVGVSVEQCRFRVQIHESADVQRAEEFWAGRVGVPPEMLSRTTLKRHQPKTNRKNVGDDYHGCLVITVLQSASLYRSIEGWWAGVHGQVMGGHRRSAAWGEVPPWRASARIRRKLK